MSGKQRLLFFLLILALAVGGAAAWWGSLDSQKTRVVRVDAPRDVSRDLESGGGNGSARFNPLTRLEEGDGSSAAQYVTTVVHPLELELVQLSKGTFAGSELPPPGSDANARLKGLVRGNRGEGVPATVTFTAGPNAGRVLQSDSAGRFGASDLYQGLSIVRIDAEHGRSSEREVALRQLTETLLNLDMSAVASAHVRGIVRDLKGNLVEGAEVRFDGGRAMSDALGEFSFSRITPGKTPLVVKKHGYAHAYQIVNVVRSRPIKAENLIVTLHPGVDLEVRVEMAVGSPGPVQLFVLPVGGQMVSTGLGARTFPWHEVSPVDVHPGGSTVIEGMQEGHVSLLAFHPGAVASPPIVTKKLMPGRPNLHLIRLRAAPTTIRGTVKNADGTPARKARVRLEDSTRGFATTKAMQQRRPDYLLNLVSPHLPPALQTATTDERGRFVLTVYTKITPKGYYLTAESADGKARVNRVVKPESAELDLKLEPIEDVAGALQFKMGGRYQALAIETTVNGQPMELRVLTAEENLVIEGLDPGQWKLDVWWNQDRLEEGRQFTVHPSETYHLPLVLPRGAIEGQGEDEAKRAGR